MPTSLSAFMRHRAPKRNHSEPLPPADLQVVPAAPAPLTGLTVVVADAWRGTGVGHQIRHTAMWLTLAVRLSLRVLFAMCLPNGAITTDSNGRHMCH